MWHKGWCGNMAWGIIRQYGIGHGMVIWLRGLKGNVAHRMMYYCLGE